MTIRDETVYEPNMYYEYQCPQCSRRILTHRRGDRIYTFCDQCGEDQTFTRRFSISIEKPMQEHWNATLDMPISSNKQFDRELKRASEEASEYAGVEQRYERVDITDRAALGVTDEGLDATNRVRVNSGLPPIKID